MSCASSSSSITADTRTTGVIAWANNRPTHRFSGLQRRARDGLEVTAPEPSTRVVRRRKWNAPGRIARDGAILDASMDPPIPDDRLPGGPGRRLLRPGDLPGRTVRVPRRRQLLR